ncbi:ARM repeat-containing protein [Tothia fuscella]|uniref:ARM repeat-containing protein n=1 Tax=Tothia fuscella TaxID=1048955 RepID=A0A9P4NJ18_9PEZI|nr:ARM repeat-containing protein [Tothia fuscella]
MAEQEEDFSALPLPDRFAHKNWKVRKEAYEAAAKEFDSAQSEADPVVRQFILDPGLWKAAVADSNVAAQQEALGSLISFLNIAGPQGCTRTRNLTIVPIVEKGLAATRPVAKQKALEALLLYIELDKADPVIEELLPLLAHKQPKIIAATLAALREIYHAYGCKTVEPKPTLKALPKIYGHADKNVRAEGQNLTVELYRWLREAMKPLFWNDLKPVQQTDLEKLFEKVKDEPAPKQERLLRSQQAIKEAAPVAEAEEDDDGVIAYDDEAEIDLEPEYVAVDVLAKMPKDLFERLASSKWKDRKEALDDLHTAINHPKIADGQYSDLLAALAKCMKDANIAVVTVAAGCIEIIANGLKKSFAKYRGTVMGPMMERLKEKKQSVTDAIGAALDAVFAATNGYGDCLEEMLEFLKHKNPQVKLESTRFLIRTLCTTRDPPAPPELKLMVDGATKLLTESAAPQREAGAEVLGTLWKIMGDRVMNPHLEPLDEIRKTKIKEYQEKAEVKAKYKPKPAAPPPKAAPPAQKRVAGGKKPAAAAKKASAPVRAPSPFDDDPPPLAARPSTRPAQPKLAKPGTGLRPPGGLRKPQAVPGPYSQAAQASPVRRLVSPTEDAAPIPQPKLSSLGPGRGLAGRPLGKPAPQRAESPPPDSPPYRGSGLSHLSSAERAELDELRVEVERLRRENEHIRQEKGKISSQIHELTNQNAQLIEDHTRDVLSIKAKETQLVRARSDEEEARQQVAHQQREIDRLKRELSRQVRASSPAPMDVIEHIYNDEGRNNNSNSNNNNNGGFTSSYTQQSQSRTARSSRSYVTSPTDSIVGGGGGGGDRGNNNGYGPPSYAPPAHQASSPRRGLQGPDGEISRAITTGSVGVGSAQGGAQSGQVGGGPESWKRAAEVTQNLKARIEMMKAKQGLSRPH